LTELTKQVGLGADDGRDDGTFRNFQSYVIIGYGQRSFFRFTSVSIPKNSIINSAKLQFKAAASNSGTTCNVIIHFEAADNPSAPSDHADLLGRSLTTGTAWSSVGSWTGSSWYDSADIASELQAIVDRAGWVENNAVTAHVLDNGSSSGAYRQPQGYEAGASYAVKLVVDYSEPPSGEVADGVGANDATAAFSLTETLADQSGAGDAVEAYDFAGVMADGAGASESLESYLEKNAEEADAAAASDTLDGYAEIEVAIADATGAGGDADAFNWTEWIADNLHLAVARYYCTITGAADDLADVIVPISSFQARKETDSLTYVSVVVPGMASAEDIAARQNGEIVVDMAYLVGGIESLREEILRAEIEQINIYEGADSRSIVISGHQDQTFIAKDNELRDPIYSAQVNGRLSWRFAAPDLFLNPGDTARVGDDAITVNAVIYMVSAGGGQTMMEVQE
jgi:hypothetical protein